MFFVQSVGRAWSNPLTPRRKPKRQPTVRCSRPRDHHPKHSSHREDALQALNDVVTVLRKKDLVALRRMVAPSAAVSSAGRPKSSRLGRVGYREGGVLVDFTDVFDLGSRRLLPSNLLRRSQVLSVMERPSRAGDGNDFSHLIRQKVTAKSGEEGILLWELSASKKLVSCVETSRIEEASYLRHSHPRNSPDVVLASYLALIQRNDFVGSQEFTGFQSVYEGLDLSGLGRFDGEYRTRLEAFFSRDASDVSASKGGVPYSALARCDEWVFAEGVLLDQHHMVREVVVRVGDGDWAHWAFELSLSVSNNGCWVITAVRHLPDDEFTGRGATG